MFNFITKLFKKSITISDETNFGWTDYFHTLPSPTKINLAKEYHNIIYACANMNATACAAVSFKLYVQTRSNDEQPKSLTKSINKKQQDYLKKSLNLHKAIIISEVMEHPLLDLFDFINDKFTGYELFELTMLYLDMLGNAYWYVPKDVLGRPESLNIIPSQYMEIMKDPYGKILYYHYSSGRSPVQDFKPEEIIHFKTPSLSPYSLGLGPNEAAYEVSNLLNTLRSFEYKLLKNDASPGLFFTPKEEMGIEEKLRTEARWIKKFRKGGTGGLFIGDPGDNIEKISIPPKELEALLLQKITKLEICNVFGIPGALMDSAQASKAQMDASYIQHATNAILPRLRRFESRLNKELLQLYDNRLFIKFDNPIHVDQLEEAQLYQTYKNAGIMTVDEIRENLGLEPLKNNQDNSGDNNANTSSE